MKKESCMTCGIGREQMTEIPWGRYIKNTITQKYEDFIQCKSCREAEIKDQIRNFQASKGDTEYTNEIICPHCGNKHERDAERSEFYTDGTHDFECGNCGNEFEVTTCVSISYSTYIKQTA